MDIQEGQEYPVVGITGERVKNLPAQKKGFQIPITREAVLADDTETLLQTARRAGEVLAQMKEDAILRMVAGVVPNCVIERRRDEIVDTVSDLFLSSGRWTNSHVNPLTSWTDFDDAIQLLSGNIIPSTGQNAILNAFVLLVPYQLHSLAHHIVNAIETRTQSSTNVTIISGSPYSTEAGRPVQLIVSQQLYRVLTAAGVPANTAAKVWYFGDLVQAFRYYQLWPIEVEEESAPSQRYTHDIWVRFRVSECGVPVCLQPRVWSRNLPS